MISIDTYILEKLHLRKGANNMQTFIDGFDDKDKREIVSLIKNCIDELKRYDVSEDHWCYIIKPKNKNAIHKYMWDSNRNNDHYNIGDDDGNDTTVLFIVKKGDEIPPIYKNLAD